MCQVGRYVVSYVWLGSYRIVVATINALFIKESHLLIINVLTEHSKCSYFVNTSSSVKYSKTLEALLLL